MEETSKYYTLKGYQLAKQSHMTAAAEDYLEMILRLEQKGEHVRIRTIAEYLNVRPSSASKMVTNLRELKLVDSEKYGIIHLTQEGRELGTYLLYRHEVLHEFLCFINGTEEELEQVEKIEHFIDERTIKNMELFVKRKV